MGSGVKTLALALWAPLLAGTLMAAATWLVWFYTTIPCTPENAIELMCRPGWLSSYVSTAVLRDCIVHSGIAITITGGSDIMLFLQERRRTNQERQRNDQIMEMMKAFLEEAAEQRRQIVEERRQIDEERRHAEERAVEERRQAAAERQAFLEALNRLTDAIVQNGRDSQ